LQWSRTPDGTWRTALRIRSGGAFGVRLGVEIEKLPPAAVLRLYAPGQREKARQTTGRSILQLLQANLAAGDTSANGRTWWAPSSRSEEAVLEIDLPSGASPDMLRFSIPQVSHVAVNLSLLPADGTQSKLHNIGRSESCQVNVECSTSPAKQATAEAVARINCIKNGRGYLCTGTLLDNTSGDETPYFLTANHCIKTPAEAASASTYWFFQAASCGGSTVQGNWVKREGGAQLLLTREENDSTLLKLNYQPPAGATFAKWNATTWSSGEDAVGIHHPAGDLKKISSATIDEFQQCWIYDDGSSYRACLSFNGTLSHLGNYFSADFVGAGVEGGSSGSPLLNTAGAVKGVLHGSAGNVCNNKSGKYGRFDDFYPHVRKWLHPTASPAAVLDVKALDGLNTFHPVIANATPCTTPCPTRQIRTTWCILRLPKTHCRLLPPAT